MNQQPQYPCPRCGAPIQAGQPTCGNCGLPLDPASVAAFQQSQQRAPAPYPMAPPRQGGPNVLLIIGAVVGALVLLCVLVFVAGALITPSRSTVQTQATEVAGLVAQSTATAAPSLPTATAAAQLATLAPGVSTQTPRPPATNTIVAPPTKTTVPVAGTAPPATVQAGGTGVKVLDFVSYDDAIGLAHVIGVVQNIGSAPVDQIQLVASWLDSKGDTAATGEDNILTSVILDPGQKAPFDVLLFAKAPASTKIQIQTQAETYDPTGFTLFQNADGLKIEGDKLGQGTLGATVTGRVVNNGKTPATLIQVLVTGYDAKGKLVDVAESYAKLDPLQPGGTSPFSVDLLRDGVKVAKYDILVRGYEK